MRKLTLYPRMGDANIKHIESLIGTPLCDDFKEFLKDNAGLSHYERFFTDHNQVKWEVTKYLTFIELHKLLNEFQQEYKRNVVPFAFDRGGWHFCLCLEQGKEYGSVVINRWTDHLPEDQFLKIADSFESFIDKLEE